MGVTVGSPTVEEICNYLLIPALEDDVDHLLVVFRMSEFGRYPGMLWIEVTEANLQQKEEKSFSICEAGVILEYHRT